MNKGIYKNLNLHQSLADNTNSGSREALGTPKTHEEYVACLTAERFHDFKSLRFYKKCFRENYGTAKLACAYVSDQPNFLKIKNPGSLFTWKFKQLVDN